VISGSGFFFSSGFTATTPSAVTGAFFSGKPNLAALFASNSSDTPRGAESIAPFFSPFALGAGAAAAAVVAEEDYIVQ
jgi:hypothetical protein